MKYSLQSHCPDCFAEQPANPVCPRCGFDSSRYADNNKSLPPFTELTQDLVLGRTLGEGGFGIVYAGYSKLLGELAVKEFFPERIQLAHRTRDGHTVSPITDRHSDFNFWRDRFYQECFLLWKFRDIPTIINPAREPVEMNGTYYLVMERLRGSTFLQFLQLDQGRAARVLDAGEALAFFTTLLKTLKPMHDHQPAVYHRDVSGGNIFLVNNDLGRIKLLDFGLARGGESLLSLTRSTMAGTAEFASPEQLRGDPIGATTDIYSAAAVLYAGIYGRLPDSAMARSNKDTMDFSPVRGLPSRLTNTVKACMRLDPGERPQSVDEVLRMLHHEAGGEAVLTLLPGKTNPKKPGHKNTVWPWATAIAALLGIVLAAFWLQTPGGVPVETPLNPQATNPRPDLNPDNTPMPATSLITAPKASPAPIQTPKPQNNPTAGSKSAGNKEKTPPLAKNRANPVPNRVFNRAPVKKQPSAPLGSAANTQARVPVAPRRTIHPVPPAGTRAGADKQLTLEEKLFGRRDGAAARSADQILFGKGTAQPESEKPLSLREKLFGRNKPFSDDPDRPLTWDEKLFGREKKTYRFTRMGVDVRNPDPGAHGVLVVSVMGPASKAGIRKGDIILLIDRRETRNVSQLREVLKTLYAGGKFNFLVQRSGKTVFLTMEFKPGA